MPNADEMWEQLALLRGVTATTGALHEAQVLQLKMWPRLAVPHSVSSEFTWNPLTKRVIFYLKTEGEAPADLQMRLEGLDRSIKSLLGEEWTLEVIADDAHLFTSPPFPFKAKADEPGA